MSGFEEVTEAKLPYGMGEIDLFSVTGLLAIGGLVLGLMVWNAADAVGARLANSALAAVGQVLPGGNPATASNDSGGPAFGGE